MLLNTFQFYLIEGKEEKNRPNPNQRRWCHKKVTLVLHLAGSRNKLKIEMEDWNNKYKHILSLLLWGCYYSAVFSAMYKGGRFSLWEKNQIAGTMLFGMLTQNENTKNEGDTYVSSKMMLHP